MKLFSLILAVISLTSFSEAHHGGLDANGGYYNRKTGGISPTIGNQRPNQQRKKKRSGSAQRARPTIKAADIIELAKDMPVIRLAA